MAEAVTPKDGKSHHIVVFVVGGVTYEEARFVANANQSGHGLTVVLGGTTITNSQSFVQDLGHCTCKPTLRLCSCCS